MDEGHIDNSYILIFKSIFRPNLKKIVPTFFLAFWAIFVELQTLKDNEAEGN